MYKSEAKFQNELSKCDQYGRLILFTLITCSRIGAEDDIFWNNFVCNYQVSALFATRCVHCHSRPKISFITLARLYKLLLHKSHKQRLLLHEKNSRTINDHLRVGV